jgi:hypothetical protein
MNDNSILAISEDFNASRPPHSIELLRAVANVDWDTIRDSEIELCLNIIHKVNANVILCIFDIQGDERVKYKEVFHKILDNIKKSTINDRSLEFLKFFERYNEYVQEI